MLMSAVTQAPPSVVFNFKSLEFAQALIVAHGPLDTATPDPDTLAYAERLRPW